MQKVSIQTSQRVIPLHVVIARSEQKACGLVKLHVADIGLLQQCYNVNMTQFLLFFPDAQKFKVKFEECKEEVRKQEGSSKWTY